MSAGGAAGPAGAPRDLPAAAPGPRLGLRANAGPFVLLLLINAFVGAMVGLERTVLPLVAEREFGIASRSGMLSFVFTFGLAKALANLAAGGLADRRGRRATLIAGWVTGLPVPWMIAFAPAWSWVVAANVLLGIQQGLCWSAAVVMKVDLAGPGRRGLAIGLNEASGYLALSLAALASGYVAASHGLRPWPFLLGVGVAAAGLACSLLTRDTRAHAGTEAALAGVPGEAPRFKAVLARVSWRSRPLAAVSQAGLVNNLNDGMAWGLFPLHFAAGGAGLERIAVLVALYPAVWGFGQIAAGPLSDRIGRRIPMVAGLALQGAALLAIGGGGTVPVWTASLVALGAGTALVYPVLLGAVSDHAPPAWRASAMGVYRLWRDLGYAAGAVLAGAAADQLGIGISIQAVGGLTLLSGVVVAALYRESHSGSRPPAGPDQRPAAQPKNR